MALLSSSLGRGLERVSAARFALLARSYRPTNHWALLSRPTFSNRLNSRRETLPDKPDAVQVQLHTHYSFNTHRSLPTNPLRSSVGWGWSLASGLLVALALVAASLVGPDKASAKDEGPGLIYPPLSNSTDSLRLLVLLPGAKGQSIRCQLVSTTFSANPQYEALSYAWGANPKSALQSISVNGAQVKVGRNLWCALSHLRNATYARVLWIDALCINQDDTDEKNKQIPLMLFIYSRAKGVLVWLGTQSPPLAIDTLTPEKYVAQQKHAREQQTRKEMNGKLNDI